MNELQPGQCAYIQAVEGEGALRHHLLDMGLTPGTEITLQKIAPMGDPVQIKVRGYELTLRLEEAQKIEIDGIHPEETCNPEKERAYQAVPHPGVGELGKAKKERGRGSQKESGGGTEESRGRGGGRIPQHARPVLYSAYSMYCMQLRIYE